MLNGKLYVATAKGKGTGPNNFRQRQTARDGVAVWEVDFDLHWHADLWVAGGAGCEGDGEGASEVDGRGAGVEPDEGGGGEDSVCRRQTGSQIKHVIYIIKENRTYDQIFGDLKQNGKRVGNGDASLTMYGKDDHAEPA